MKKFLPILIFLSMGCALLPKRQYVENEMKLSPDKKESVFISKVDDYVKAVMEDAKGYVEPDGEDASSLLVWLYVAISGLMFVAGFACFGIAMMTHLYKANAVGLLCLVGAGVAAGFAEFASFWWTVPVAGIIGLFIWFFTHHTKEFSLPRAVQSIWRKHYGTD